MRANLIVVADSHAEKSRVGWVAYAVFDMIGKVMLEHKATGLIHGGDWFDTRGKIPTMVGNRLYNKIKEFISKYGSIYTVVGNHDLAVSEGGVEESALHVFEQEIDGFYAGDAQEPKCLCDTPVLGCDIYLIGYSSSVNLEELVRNIEIDPNKVNIAVMHQVTMCSETSTGYIFGEGVDAELLSKKFTFSILGDIHKPQLVLDNVLVPGAPYAMDFSDNEDRGCWLIAIDTVARTVKPTFVPLPAPRFYTVEFSTPNGLEAALQEAREHKQHFYRFKFPEALSAALTNYELPVNVFPVPETTETQEARVDLSKPEVDVVVEYVTYAHTEASRLDKALLVDIGHKLLEEATQ